MSSDKVTTKGFLVQGLATVALAYLTTLTGFIYAWPSYSVANFMSNDTVLSEPMSTIEISLLGSLTNIGALLPTPFCGYAINTLGRKYAAIVFGLPFVLAWLVISLTNYVPLVIAAIFFAGIGAGGQPVISVYISEISQDSIRGALTSSVVSGYFLGLLISYVLGGYLSHYHVVYVHLAMSVLYLVMLAFLKESPVYLMQMGKDEEAAKSIAFYRQVDVKSKEVEVEMRKLKQQLEPRLEILLQTDKDPTVTKDLYTNKPKAEKRIESKSEWQFLKKSPSSIRALITCLIVMGISILMGAVVLQVYAEPLFKEAVPSMEPNQCAILLAVDFVVASLLCAVMVDRFGRKPLVIVTSIAAGICTLLLGTQLQFHWAPHWFTAVLIYAYCFSYNCGAAVIPFIIAAEMFLPEVRGLCNSMVTACLWVMNFVTLMVFTPLVEQLGLGPIFYGFSLVCFLGAIYCSIWLPETRGMSADAIQLLFLKKVKRGDV